MRRRSLLSNEQMQELRKQGMTYRAIGEIAGISSSAVYFDIHPGKLKEWRDGYYAVPDNLNKKRAYMRAYYANNKDHIQDNRREYMRHYMRHYHHIKRGVTLDSCDKCMERGTSS